MTTTYSAGRSLDQSLVSGIAWTGIVKWSMQVLSWVATLATVRMLAPTDYGLFGMAMVYIGFGQIITEAGISAAVIQRPNLTERETAELCGLSVIVGILFTMATLAVAAPVAMFFAQPSVQGILIALSPLFIIRSLQLVPRTLLARELRFRASALIDVVESLSLVLATLVLALMGWRYWALVAGSVVSAVATVLVVVRHRFVRPAMPTELIRAPIRFSRDVTIGQVSWYAYTNADFAIVGRMLGSVALGAYSFAWTIANVVGERVSALIGRVTPPLFAAVQNDPAALRRYLGLVVEGIALLTLPASVGLSLVADEFVPVVAGGQWAAAIGPLRILALYAAFRSIFYVAPQLLIATGRARTSMRFGLLATLVLPPAFIVGAQFGATGVAAAWVLVYPMLALLTYVRATLQATQMTWAAYGAALWPAARATLVMAAVVLAIRAATPATVAMKAALLIHSIAGALTYCALVGIGLRTRLRPLVAMLKESVWRTPLNTKPVFAPGPRTAAGRILVISYHFTPSSAVGALRWQKLVQLGAERGWEFDVIALTPSELKSPDHERSASLPTGTRVFGVPTRTVRLLRLTRRVSQLAAKWKLRTVSNGGLRSRASSLPSRSQSWLPRHPRDLLRAYFAWLDVRNEMRWASDAAQLALAIHEPGVHRAVVTCGPPHEPHVAGVSVSEATGLPLIADFRDPWSLQQRLPEAIASRVWLSMASLHERRAIRAASLVVTNTTPLRAAMAQLYPESAHKVITVMNGYDEEPMGDAPPPGRFVIAYAGSIYLDRDPRTLFRGVARAIAALGLNPSQLSVEFMGEVAHYSGEPLAAMAEQEGIGEYVVLHASRPRAQALEFLSQAAMLVVLPQDSSLAIPAKLFDYMRCKAWLLALAEPWSATAGLLAGAGNSVDVVVPSDAMTIAATVQQRFLEFQKGRRATPLSENAAFSRRAQAERLFTAIESITGSPNPPGPIEQTDENSLVAVS
jgi:O-antigen/teichoic acid export membrane protein